MAKRQTRRSVSVKGTTYARLLLLAERLGNTGSGQLEELIKQACENAGIPEVTVLPPRRPKRPRSTDEIASQHFTF